MSGAAFCNPALEVYCTRNAPGVPGALEQSYPELFVRSRMRRPYEPGQDHHYLSYASCFRTIPSGLLQVLQQARLIGSLCITKISLVDDVGTITVYHVATYGSLAIAP